MIFGRLEGHHVWVWFWSQNKLHLKRKFVWLTALLSPEVFKAVILTHWPLRDVPEIFFIFFQLIVLIWMSQNHIDCKSALVQVMAWCHQATSHYLSQCCPISMLPYSITRPQWVNPYNAKFILEIINLYIRMFHNFSTLRWWNHTSWKTMTYLSCIDNAMVADDLETQGARTQFPGLIITCQIKLNETGRIIPMGQCKKDVIPLLTHWSYVFLTLTHRYFTLFVSRFKIKINRHDLCFLLEGGSSPFFTPSVTIYTLVLINGFS